MTKFIIAGGTGLIGSALGKSLLAQGHQVGVISRTPARIEDNFQPISWEQDSLLEGLSESDVVINLAGSSLAGNNPLQMRWTKNRKEAIITSRLAAGEKLVNAISKLDQKPEVFVQASAIGYYGNQGLDPADENTGPGGDFLTDICLDWESSTAPLEEMGIRRIVTRIGLVISHQGGLLPLLALPFHLFVGGRIGSGNQYYSWIHIQDIVGSIQFLINEPRLQGVFNLTSPNPVTNRIFAQALGKTLRRPVWFPIPAAALKIGLGEAATLALEGRPVHPSRLLQSGYQFTYPDLNNALRDLFTT
jgi:uncharacterized protein (TIGR01777 family)